MIFEVVFDPGNDLGPKMGSKRGLNERFLMCFLFASRSLSWTFGAINPILGCFKLRKTDFLAEKAPFGVPETHFGPHFGRMEGGSKWSNIDPKSTFWGLLRELVFEVGEPEKRVFTAI